ncbi:hypothetical protein [Caballeronia sp. DA-9]
MGKLYAAAARGQPLGARRAGDHCGRAGWPDVAGAMIMTGGVVSVGTPL